VNVRRGLWRLWIAASAFWVGFWVWHYFKACSPLIRPDGSADEILCDTNEVSGNVVRLAPFDLLQVTEITIGIPIAVLGIGLIVAWILRGFRSV
jgi:hypothetical protein